MDQLNITAINVEDPTFTEHLNTNGTVWRFNPPHASHMGGMWERMIGVARCILDAMLLDVRNRNLTHKVLVTLMAEVAAIINSRLIVSVSADPDSPLILTPSILLTQKTGNVSGTFPQDLEIKDMYKSQWKCVQVLAETFWNRWRKEYLPNLQTRCKWHDRCANVKEGDVVLLKDLNVARNDWPTALVQQVFPGSDGLVRKAELRVIKRDTGKAATYIRPVSDMVMLISD